MTRKSEWPKNLRLQKTSLALPRDLWEAAKIQAIKQGRTLQELVADALDGHLKQLRKGGSNGKKG